MDDHRGTGAQVGLVTDPVGATRDVLEDPVVLSLGQERQVAGDHLFGDGSHVLRRFVHVEFEVTQGPVETVDVFREAKQPAVDRAFRVEGAVSPAETPVAERDDDMAFRNVVAVEVGDSLVGTISHEFSFLRQRITDPRECARSSVRATSEYYRSHDMSPHGTGS